MRTIILCFLTVLTSLIFSCNDKDENTATVDTPVQDSTTVADSVSLTAVIDSLHEAFKMKSIDRMNLHFSEGGTFIGTDPGEFWTRKELNDYLSPSFKRDTTPSAYTVSKRAIEMSTDKRSAVVIDQFTLPFSPKLPVRSIAFAEYMNNRWSIKMFSWNFIADNADVDKLNETLK